MKIVIAIDSFKGCLSSSEAAEAAAKGITAEWPDINVIRIPIADGGEGTIEAFLNEKGSRRIAAMVHNQLMEPMMAEYGVLPNGTTAVIEMAAANGLELVPIAQRDIMNMTTFGTGEMIADAIRRGCRHFILGAGGSGTCDAGFGMLQALGFRFYDKNKRLISSPITGTLLNEISNIDEEKTIPELKECNFKVAADVTNPFCGKYGAAFVFARQKGAGAIEIDLLEKGLRNIVRLTTEKGKINIASLQGAGAGGGFAGGCAAYLGAKIASGIDIVLQHHHYDMLIDNTLFVLTGEGRIDSQTVGGKVVSGIAQATFKRGIPVFAIAGDVNLSHEDFPKGLTAVFPIQPSPVPYAKAMTKDFAADQIARTAGQICRIFKPGI